MCNKNNLKKWGKKWNIIKGRKKTSEPCGILITAHAPGPSRRVVKPQHLTWGGRKKNLIFILSCDVHKSWIIFLFIQTYIRLVYIQERPLQSGLHSARHFLLLKRFKVQNRLINTQISIKSLVIFSPLKDRYLQYLCNTTKTRNTHNGSYNPLLGDVWALHQTQPNRPHDNK